MAKLKDDPAVQELIAKAVAKAEADAEKARKSLVRDLTKTVTQAFTDAIASQKEAGNRDGARLLNGVKVDVVAAIKAPF